MVRLPYALGGIFLIGFASYYVLSAPRALNVGAYEKLAGTAAAGEAVFWAAGCASCHMVPGALGDDQLILAGGAAVSVRLWHVCGAKYFVRQSSGYRRLER